MKTNAYAAVCAVCCHTLIMLIFRNETQASSTRSRVLRVFTVSFATHTHRYVQSNAISEKRGGGRKAASSFPVHMSFGRTSTAPQCTAILYSRGYLLLHLQGLHVDAIKFTRVRSCRLQFVVWRLQSLHQAGPAGSRRKRGGYVPQKTVHTAQSKNGLRTGPRCPC